MKALWQAIEWLSTKTFTREKKPFYNVLKTLAK